MNNKQENLIRQYVRKKIKESLQEHKVYRKQVLNEENRLRKVIRELLKEGDISDMHPHRSTGINVLEDVLKKMITTLRTDYKRMTTNKNQRDSFRAHMISAVKGALAPSLVNDTYLQGTDTLLSEPAPEMGGEEEPLDELDMQLQEIDIEIEDEDKKIPVEDDEQPDEKRLAARTARAFLGIRLDCVQCHDDHLQGKWLQQDFHQLAAFFAGAKSSPLGIQDVETQYEYQYLGGEESVEVPTRVPFLKTLDVKHEVARVQLANWVTHPENVAFRRALVNRLWSLMMGKPLIEPIDDIPLNGPLPAGLEALSIDFAENNFNLRRLIRLMASTNVFQLDSRTEGGATLEQEQHWAVFPLTRLRPEQVAGSIQQASSLTTIDAGSHVLIRLARYQEGLDFVERYGDRGEDEYGERAGTIPQRLLMMNGKLVGERTKEDVFNNAVSRIAAFAENDDVAIESAYLCVLTRRPSPSESDFFRERLDGKKGRPRQRELEDLYWSLINSTEFSWNH